MPRNYKLISSDSHLEILPERWVDRIPKQYSHFAPRRIKLPNGSDALQIAGQRADSERRATSTRARRPASGSRSS